MKSRMKFSESINIKIIEELQKIGYGIEVIMENFLGIVTISETMKKKLGRTSMKKKLSLCRNFLKKNGIIGENSNYCQYELVFSSLPDLRVVAVLGLRRLES